MRIEEELKLDYSDVLFRPKRSTLKSRKDVNLLRTYRFKYSKNEWSGIPIMAANMDGVGELGVAEKLNEYGTATIEVHKDSINEEDKVLIIDDLIATGGTAEAAAKLVEISKGKVAAFVFVINLFDLGGSDNLLKNNYKVENLIEFPGH